MAISKITAGTTALDPAASTGAQVATAVNKLIDATTGVETVEAITLKGLPQTVGAPAGYGDLAENILSTAGKGAGVDAKFSPMWIDATDPGFTVTDVLGSATIEYNSTAPNGRVGVKVTLSSASRIRINALTNMQFDGNLFLEMYGSRTLTNLGQVQIEAYEVVGAGEKGWRATRGTIAAPLDNAVEQGGQINYHYGPHTPLTSFGTSPAAAFKIAQFSVRVQPEAAGSATMWIFGAGVSVMKRKSRIAIVFDDGWRSVATLGAQPLLSRSIPFTVAVIPTAVDQKLSEYMTMAQMRSLVNGGCSVIAHGPISGNPAGSLIENFTTTEARLNDVKSVIEWIRTNDLHTPGYETCYIWPRGKFQDSINDTSLLEGILSIGVTNARSTQDVTTYPFRGAYDAMSPHGRLAMPIIGHEAAPTLALEPANIAAIIQKINDLSAAGGVDMHLMLHKVMRDEDATDSNRSITILLSGLVQIADAIKAKVDAGQLEAVLMQDFSGFKA